MTAKTAFVYVGVVLGVASAGAQTASADSAPLPGAFAGVGVGPSTNDAASRMRLYEEGLAAIWLVEAGAAVSQRVGVGVEYSQPSVATAFTTVGLGRAQIAGRQEERLLLATARARLAGVNRWALDVVGGAGILFQHHESGGCMPAQTRCENTDDLSLDERAPAFAAGVDVPFRVARHLEIAPAARVFPTTGRAHHRIRCQLVLAVRMEIVHPGGARGRRQGRMVGTSSCRLGLHEAVIDSQTMRRRKGALCVDMCG